MSCADFYQAHRPLVLACDHHALGRPQPALLLMDHAHDEFMTERARELGVDVLVRAASDCGAAILALSRDSLCALLEGSGGDVEVARERIKHTAARTLLILHQGEYLLVQPGVHHATA